MKKSSIIFFILFIFSSQILLLSQNISKYTNWQLKQYAVDAEAKHNFVIAKNFYSLLQKRQNNDLNITFKLAELQLKTRDYIKAKNNFLKIYKSKNKNYKQAWYYYCLILKMQGKYNKAKKNFIKLFKDCDNKKDLKLKYLCKLQLKGIELSEEKPDSNIFIHHLDRTINTPHLETSPIIINDTAFVYASYKIDSIEIVSSDTNAIRPLTHFYLATKQNGKWTGNKKPPLPFFNFREKSTANGAFSLDHQRFYFTVREFNAQGILISHLYYTKYKNAKWSKPQKIGNNINSDYFDSTQPTVGYSFNPNQEIIYFISNRPGGWGGYDIWFTIYDKIYDQFSEAINAGGYINTFADEKTPFYDNKNKKMYFSSNGYPSFGGFDIFYSLGEITNWTEAQNLGKPINSSFDDFYFCQLPNKITGLFISNRNKALNWGNKNCCFDIFLFNQSSNKNIKISGNLYTSNISISEYLKKDLLNDSISEKTKFEKFINNAVVSLQVKNKIDSTYFTLFKDTTDTNGNFNFFVSPNQDYNIAINANGYLFNNYSFSVSKNATNSINLGKIKTERIAQNNIILRNILFNFNSSQLTDSSKLYLDTVVIPVLKKYNNIVIEIGAHTDSKGSNEYNLKLSQKRAESVVKYLSAHGIAFDRLKAVGYGETKPLVPEKNADGTDNPEARSLNRRVEFKIIGIKNHL